MRIWLAILVLSGVVGAQTTIYQNLRSDDNFFTEIVTAHRVQKPTAAALDMAFWHHNSLFSEPGGELEVPATPYFMEFKQLYLNGVFSRVENRMEATGLRPEVRALPLSFPAVRREAQVQLGWSFLSQVQSSLNLLGPVRATRLLVQPFNKILPWKSKTRKAELWVEIELNPGTEIPGVRDRNGDGIPEVYAQINPALLSRDTLEAFVHWVEQVYTRELLDSAQVLAWAQNLAGHLYPALNTDLEWNVGDLWPTDSLYLRALQGRKIAHPTVVIKGNPLGKVHYTVIDVPGMKAVANLNSNLSSGAGDERAPTSKIADRNLPQNYVENMARWEQELAEHGSYENWEKSLQVWRNPLQQRMAELDASTHGLVGQNPEWLYFRRSLAYSVGGDVQKQGENADPTAALITFKSKLEELETNMLFVPVPPKTEVYGEHLTGDSSLSATIFNPWGRKYLNDLQEDGMEVVDLLPLYLTAKQNSPELLYQKRDTHWDLPGMLVAAEKIAQRIKQYAWYAELQPDTARFSTEATTYTRLGDVVERLPDSVQSQYGADTLPALRVFAEGQPYQGKRGAPIVIIGDSFTGVMESTDAKNGGIGAHIARLIGLDVEVITSWGGGPNVRSRLWRARQAELQNDVRLVIYLMAARDLYEYPGGWDPESF
ncbi:MAG: hypothetical protein GX801_06865 [Fibrobacter sp.]|nr:hypothetical protein [Fibrobacter sp.]